MKCEHFVLIGMPPQKNVQNNTTAQAVTTFIRPPSGIVQPQQLFINAVYSNVGASADIRSRPSSMCDVLPFSSRPVDYRRYSAASSMAFEPKEFPIKIDSPSKPPTSAPSSILVKPDTPKSSSDKVTIVKVYLTLINNIANMKRYAIKYVVFYGCLISRDDTEGCLSLCIFPYR